MLRDNLFAQDGFTAPIYGLILITSVYIGMIFDSKIFFSFQKVFTTYKKISDAFNTNAETDSSGQYKIISVSQKVVKKPLFDVTYVSQCSWNRFNFIESLLEEWQVSYLFFVDSINTGNKLSFAVKL